MKLIIHTFLLLLLAFTFIFIACSNKAANKNKTTIASSPAVFETLLGTWKHSNGRLFERWSKNENGTYTSVVYTVKGNDTSWRERASIYPANEKWVYENLVSDQNAGKAVRFTSISISSSSVQFSNPAHDFPTDISYTLPDANTLHAFIVGPDNKGGKDTIPFNYTRLR